jgi:integrase
MAGNVTKLREGYYRLRYRDESQYVKAKTDREAEKLLAKFITDVDSGDFEQPTKVTFKEFAKRWMKDYAEVELAPKTVYRYKQLLEARIYKAIGDKKLNKIKPLELIEFYNGLRKDHKYITITKDGKAEEKKCGPLSDQTIQHHHRLLSAIFEKAIKWGVLKGDNPAKRVDAPRVPKHRAKYFDEKQIEAMLEALQDEDIKYRAAIMIALTTGARMGEIMGLEWQDVDTKNKTISIRQASQYLPGKGTFTKAPKNESSIRKVSVNPSLIALLEEYKAEQQSKGFLCQDNNRLLLMWNGQPMHPNTLSEWFPSFLEKHSLLHMNFHGLRHTSATYLISQGMDIPTVAQRLGHSKPTTTENIYAHAVESRDKKAARLFEAAVNKKKKETKKSSS